MKISKSWLKELVNLNCSDNELINLLPLRTIGTKEITDDFIELDMKGYNRADLLSMRGVAQEVAAITGSSVKFAEKSEADLIFNDKQIPHLETFVENTNLAPLYTLVKIEGVKVLPSPPEWIKKLADCGIRSINNIADLTNLIMLEYGQPIHAFDADKVKGNVGVRLAKKGEKLTTLDGKLRELNDDLVIADDNGPIGLAGVMGGKDSEITDSTTSVLLEAAIFDSVSIRKTTQKHNLPSEAAKRFQHGLSKTRLLQALDQTIRIFMEYGPKMTAISVTSNTKDEIKTIKLTQKKINSLIGIEIKAEDVENYLQKLGFTLASQGQALGAWEVAVPYWRLDVNIEEDLIEEVARMYGYEKITPHEVSQSKPLQNEDPIFKTISDLKEKLVDLGLNEVQTYSFCTTQIIDAIELKKENLVKIANPISSETEYLRADIWPNLVEVIGRNLRKGFKDIVIFEIGKVFSNINGEPKEEYRLAIALCNETDNPLQELYQIAQDSKLQLRGAKLNKELFHPKRQTDNLAEVHLRVLNKLSFPTDKLGIEKRVAILEIGLDSMLK